MRIRLNDKDVFENVSSVEIVTGENCLYITTDESHPERNFDLQAVSAGCDDCEAFCNDECRCE